MMLKRMRNASGIALRARGAKATCKVAAGILGLLALGIATLATAQISVTQSGAPAYSLPIAVPPGIAGMAPNIGLAYGGAGANGPVGYGWSIQGISLIARCPQTRAIDGFVRSVRYSVDDKLCLDGQLQMDAA